MIAIKKKVTIHCKIGLKPSFLSFKIFVSEINNIITVIDKLPLLLIKILFYFYPTMFSKLIAENIFYTIYVNN